MLEYNTGTNRKQDALLILNLISYNEIFRDIIVMKDHMHTYSYTYKRING